MPSRIQVPKKLIEVALPLDAINEASAKEKSIRHGHPSTLHLWWARRPLATARAVIFSQVVNDPSWKWELEHPGEVPPANLKASWAATRKRLFALLEELVKWENTNNEQVLERARSEIRKSWRETCEVNKNHPQAPGLFNPEKLPPLYDPFAGGGAIPLEAIRLGFEAYASDLNPVAVLVTKAMIEIPPLFGGRSPVNAEWHLRSKEERALRQWHGAEGLAEDIRYYGSWMRDEAQERIGHLFPPIEITAKMTKNRPDLKGLVGQHLTVIAWLWARTVKSPNPAFSHVDIPLASSFVLSSKEGKQAYVHPIVEGDKYRFTVKVGTPPKESLDGTKLSRGSFRCLLSNTPFQYSYIDDEANAGRMGARLMAIVAEGPRGRVYLDPTEEMDLIARSAQPTFKPDAPSRGTWASNAQGRIYGFHTFGDYFTPRQLVALTTFSNLVTEARNKIYRDSLAAGESNDSRSLAEQGIGAKAYAEAISVYLALAIDKAADYWSSLCSWHSSKELIRNTFGRQAIPMIWDYAETNVFSNSAGNVLSGIEWAQKVLAALPKSGCGSVFQAAAQSQDISKDKIISTDPPYYDNIGYADLSDFFYVWLRRSMRSIYPDLFATVAVPKAEELVATPHRHGGKEKAEAFFLDGMTLAMHRLAERSHPAVPITIYYARKQSESENAEGVMSTGWEIFLEAMQRSGLVVTGTWPMQTELVNRMVGSGTNALASSIVLVCRPRSQSAPTVSRRAFLRELNQVLPEALDEMTRGAGSDRSPVAPVDLSQAILGPGMAIFSKYSAVLEADGNAMSVKSALQLINRFLAEDDFDHDTQFCLHWFEQYGWQPGKFGEADTLARAKGTSVDGVKQAGVLFASGGIVRLLKWAEYPQDWDPLTDSRLPLWEVLHHLIRVFKSEGESGAARTLAAVPTKAEATRQLAYRLYALCERAGWVEDARAYNEIVSSWSPIESAAARVPGPKQTALFDA